MKLKINQEMVSRLEAAGLGIKTKTEVAEALGVSGAVLNGMCKVFVLPPPRSETERPP